MFDKDIPVPGRKHPDFKAMAVGESVFIPHEGGILKCASYIYAATIQKRSDVYRFVGRSVTEDGVNGVRIWRSR